MPLASAQLRDAINSANPARAALTAIVAFHGLKSGQLRKVQLTDIHRAPPSGPAHHPTGQTGPDRLAVWLAYRKQCWPSTRNPHVFTSRRAALDRAPVGVQRITTSMGMTVQQAREDRILHELHAGGGDLRRICDMFGLLISGANRYSTVLAQPGLNSG
ncbi:hypothetical protein [Pseudarthrobacter cellobiosi]|nr:hypothetical protein [Pseudarthrobacter sp. HLT1-5]MCO4254229.1 hypothetical protein [Pseudarthrobacter sp. HLT1-5]